MNKPTLAQPVEIAKFWKSDRSHHEHVRIGIGEHKGHMLINIRVWQTGTDGIDRPTHKGIALTIRKLPELHKAITKAMEKARELGLLDHGTTSPATKGKSSDKREEASQ